MDWFTLLVIWLVAPIVEAVVIIVLLVQGSREKKEKAQQTGYSLYGLSKIPDESRLQTISVNPAVTGRENPVCQENVPYRENYIYGEKPVYQENLVYQEKSVHQKKPVYEKKPVHQETPADGEKTVSGLVFDIRDHLGTVSLIIGTVLVILSGMVFATTRWQALSDIHKVFLVFGASLLFFAVSCLAEKILHIHRTGNAFYILGSVFLFLTVLAAAYFRFLGPEFILDEGGRWKVCWAGSLVTEIALLVGLSRFHDRIYTQAGLWGIAANICFMAKALGAGWNGLMGSMAWLGVGLVLGYRYMASRKFSGKKEELASLVREELSGFLSVYFLAFCAIPALFCLDVWECWDLFDLFALIFSWERGLGCGLLSVGITALLAALSLYVSGRPFLGGEERGTGIRTGMMQGMTQAGLYSLAGVYALAGIADGDPVFRFGAVSLWFMAVQTVIFVRRKLQGRQETQKDLFMLWELSGLGSLMAGFTAAWGDEKWIFGYLLLFSLYCLRYARIPGLKRGAGCFSSCFLAAAMWEQPFISWPEVISLEIALVPAAALIFLQGLIWGKSTLIKRLQSIGYVCCLMILTADSLRTGLLADGLILEFVCLAVFIRAQTVKDVCWVRISGAFILFIALLMTREFWLSISWWAYLLVAGLGLIVFAAIGEKKKG